MWASPEIEQAWMEEIARREKLEAEGNMGYVSFEEAIADVRKIIEGAVPTDNERSWRSSGGNELLRLAGPCSSCAV